MAAGLGFKTFTTGEVLTAADTNGYLMQGVLVFTNAAARDAAITAPQEGQTCYLKSTDAVMTYSGSTWVAVGGGSPLTTKGDLYTFGTSDTRLAVGATNGMVLTVDSAEATGLKYATPAAAGFVGCSLYKTANQSIANDTNTVITWNAEYFDTNTFHDDSSNTSRITIPSGKGGRYLITGQMSFAADSDEQRIARILKNGVSAGILTAQRASIAPDSTAASFVWLIDLVATDYIELNVYQNGGGSLDFKTDGQFNAIYLGA